MDQKVLEFIDKNGAAGMLTLRRDGSPHATRVGIAIVDGKIWSSGTQSRLRTKHLRRDPRSTLFIYEATGYGYLSLDCEVTILDGPDAPQLNIKLFRAFEKHMPAKPPEGKLMYFGQAISEEDFVAKMAEEGRLVYQFDVKRTYGMY